MGIVEEPGGPREGADVQDAAMRARTGIEHRPAKAQRNYRAISIITEEVVVAEGAEGRDRYRRIDDRRIGILGKIHDHAGPTIANGIVAAERAAVWNEDEASLRIPYSHVAADVPRRVGIETEAVRRCRVIHQSQHPGCVLVQPILTGRTRSDQKARAATSLSEVSLQQDRLTVVLSQSNREAGSAVADGFVVQPGNLTAIYAVPAG